MQARRLSFIFWGVLFFGALSWEQGCSKLGDFTDPSTQPAITTSYSPTPPITVPDAVHHWGFENSGADDGTTGGWGGSLVGSASYISSASAPSQVKVGSDALQVTGAAGDGFSLSSVTMPAQMTIACWVQWTQGVGVSNAIFANSTTSTPSQSGFRLYVVDASGIVIFETTNGTTIVQVSSSTNLSSGIYAYVAVAVDTVNNVAALYINGTQSSSGVTQNGFSLNGATFIGSMASNTNPFDGNIDDCKVFDQALTSDQVQLLYSGYN